MLWILYLANTYINWTSDKKTDTPVNESCRRPTSEMGITKALPDIYGDSEGPGRYREFSFLTVL
jgi:hypothetical protein